MTTPYTLKIYRYRPEKDQAPWMQSFTVEKHEVQGIMLLDLLRVVKAKDNSLAFRFSCGAGVCGSDGMNINGSNGLACMTKLSELSDTITVRPLPGMPVIRDLVVDMKLFYKQYESVKPYLQPGEIKDSHKEIKQSIDQRQKIDGLYECILCACCTTACPSWWWNPDKFVGPAGLLWACRFIEDSRDSMLEERLSNLEGLYRLYRCRGIMNCAGVCPKGLNPSAAIATVRQAMISQKLFKKPETSVSSEET